MDVAQFRADLEREPSDRAAESAIGLKNLGPVARQQGEDPFDGIADSFPSRIEHLRPEQCEIAIENRKKQVLFAIEEMVEASAVNLRAGKEIVHARIGVALLPKQINRGLDQAFASGRGCGRGSHRRILVERSTKTTNLSS